MYDLKKIIVMGTYSLFDQEELETIVMKTNGMRIENILYINKAGTIGCSKDELKESIKSELYSDSYDDSLKIKVKEAVNGEDCIYTVAKFINKVWDSDTSLHTYMLDDDCYSLLGKLLLNYNKDIYLEDYMDIFVDKNNLDNDIYTIMKINGLKTENLIKDNKVSMIYFLHGLIEKLYSK